MLGYLMDFGITIFFVVVGLVILFYISKIINAIFIWYDTRCSEKRRRTEALKLGLPETASWDRIASTKQKD